MANPDEYVIWSIEHTAWWRPGGFGYCATLSDAGRFTRHAAEDIVRQANVVAFHECMIPVAALAGGDVLTILTRSQ